MRQQSTSIAGYQPSALSVVIATTGMALGAYHGYKRNNSIGWALWWGIAGALVPIITVPISLAQGFGKPQGAVGRFGA